jgi:hypothetical protein
MINDRIWPIFPAKAAGRGVRLWGCCGQITALSRDSQLLNLEMVHRLTL